MAEIAGSDLVDLGVGECPADPRSSPVSGDNTQFMADVAGGPVDARIHELIERDRLERCIQGDGQDVPTRLTASYVAGCPQKSVSLWFRSTAITSNSKLDIFSQKLAAV